MKILLVSSKFRPEYSGSGYRAENTYKRLSKKHSISYSVVANSVVYTDDLYYENSIYRIGRKFNYNGNIFIYRKVNTLLNMVREFYKSWLYIRHKKEEFDILHTFGNSWSVAFFTLYFSWQKKPIIRELCNEMETPLYPPPFKYVMSKIFKKRNNILIAISKRLENLCGNFGLNNVWQRPNPVDELKFKINYQNKYLLRKKISKFNDSDIVLVHLANYIPRKNHVFLLDVMLNLPNNYKLILAGPLKERDKENFDLISNRIATLGLQSRVELKKGFINNIEEYIQQSDIFLFPSKAEGLGTPIIEAQACGVPVVANIIKGITDQWIVDGVGGYVSALSSGEYALKIQKAYSISSDTLIKNSKNILKKASSSSIDYRYYQILKSINSDLNWSILNK